MILQRRGQALILRGRANPIFDQIFKKQTNKQTRNYLKMVLMVRCILNPPMMTYVVRKFFWLGIFLSKCAMRLSSRPINIEYGLVRQRYQMNCSWWFWLLKVHFQCSSPDVMKYCETSGMKCHKWHDMTFPNISWYFITCHCMVWLFAIFYGISWQAILWLSLHLHDILWHFITWQKKINLVSSKFLS